MYCKIILVANRDVFIELAGAMKLALESQNHIVDIVDDRNIGGWAKLNIVIKALRPFEHGRMTGIRILYQPEELWNRREKGYYDLSDGWSRVLELYEENVKIPKGTKNVVHCPIGYSSAFEFKMEDVPEEYDLFFYGSMTDRRKQLSQEIDKFGFNFKCLQNCFGYERNLNIMKSKIVLNMKAHDLWSYGPLHVLLAQCNKKLVLCEKVDGGYGPYVPGKHFIEWKDIKDLQDKASYYLKNEKEREELAVSIYNDIRENIPFDTFLLSALRGLI